MKNKKNKIGRPKGTTGIKQNRKPIYVNVSLSDLNALFLPSSKISVHRDYANWLNLNCKTTENAEGKELVLPETNKSEIKQICEKVVSEHEKPEFSVTEPKSEELVPA